jgi:serine/threonine protein kinase/TolB-like protein
MDAERWRRVEDLFHQALAREEPERRLFLDEQCRSDPALRDEVDRLLAADAQAPARIAATVGDAMQLFRTSISPGMRIGPYEILAVQGEGGMGIVYRARRNDEVFQKEVAIKVVKRGLGTDDLDRRFRRERQILARLEHPFIARVLDGGSTDEGLPYLVMEYVEGQNLLDYARDHGLDVTARLALFAQVCEAVAYAHHNQVVHRDLKPGNILVDTKGRPRLLDFGIAKLVGTAGAAERTDATATVGGLGLLTPRYASPEHVKGEPITERSDVYSLGVILYELLTGSNVHRMTDDSPAAIVKAVCEANVTPPSVAVANGESHGLISAEELKGDIDRIVLMALSKEPDRRYASAQTLADDLRRHLEQVPVSARSIRSGTPTGVRDRLALIGVGLVVVAGLLATVGYFGRLSGGPGATAPPGRVMLAALPLENLTGSTEQEYFIDGLHEEIISRLGRLRPDRLGVIARTSMLQYKGTKKPIALIGGELGAHYILEGSVRQARNRVRVAAQLIQVSDQAHVWVQTFDRELDDLFSVQNEIGARVADSLELEILPQALATTERNTQVNAEALASYWRGRYYWQRRWLDYPTNLERAVAHFQAAVSAAPAYADGYAALAESYESLAVYGVAPAERKALHEKGRAALDKALALKTQLPSAPVTLAMIHFQDWNWDGMERALRDALRQDPNGADTHQYLAQLLAYTARHDEADRETRLAQELDPLSPSVYKLAFWVHVTGRRWDKAQETVRRLSELAPADSTHVYFGALLHGFRRDCPSARTELAKRPPLPVGSGVTDDEYAAAYVLGRCGEPDQARRFASALEGRVNNYAQTIAAYYAGAGDRMNALAWLEESFRRHEPLLASIAVDLMWEDLRHESRFLALLHQMGLSDR